MGARLLEAAMSDELPCTDQGGEPAVEPPISAQLQVGG
jgi:hypothetical protein